MGVQKMRLHAYGSLAAAIFLLASLSAAASSVQTANAPSSPSYRVGPEDVITVLVNRHPEFSGDFYVPADGIVSFAAAGQMAVSGKTLEEIASHLTTISAAGFAARRSMSR